MHTPRISANAHKQTWTIACKHTQTRTDLNKQARTNVQDHKPGRTSNNKCARTRGSLKTHTTSVNKQARASTVRVKTNIVNRFQTYTNVDKFKQTSKSKYEQPCRIMNQENMHIQRWTSDNKCARTWASLKIHANENALTQTEAWTNIHKRKQECRNTNKRK